MYDMRELIDKRLSPYYMRMAQWWRDAMEEASTFFKHPVPKERLDKFQSALLERIHLPVLSSGERFELRVDYDNISPILLEAIEEAGICIDPRYLFFNKTEMVFNVKTDSLYPRTSLHCTVCVSKARYNAKFREDFHELLSFSVTLQGSVPIIR